MNGKKKSKGRYTDLVSIRPNGKIMYQETLFTSKDTDNDFVTRRSVSLEDGRILLFSVSKKRYQYGTLTLPQ